MRLDTISSEALKNESHHTGSALLVEKMQREGLSCCVFESGICIVNEQQLKQNPFLLQKLLNDVALLGLDICQVYQCEASLVQEHIQLLRTAKIKHSKNRNEDANAKADFLKILVTAVENNCSDIHINVSDPGTHVVFRRYGEAWRGSPILPTYNDAVQMISRALGVEGRHQASGDFDKTSIQHTSYTEKIKVGHELINVMLRFEKHPLIERGNFKTVIRINKQQEVKTLAQLNTETEFQAAAKRIMKRSQGLIGVIGPTGSGKTTMMHGMIREYPTHKFMDTLEDPVEIITAYNPLISQHNYVESIGYNNQLRSLLRLDPDAILIGEMRDDETAELAFNAARTGHLTISSLHADNVLSSLHRLSAMGIPLPTQGEGELLLMLVSCRLVPILCDCKLPHQHYHNYASNTQIYQRNSAPCPHCFNGIDHIEPVIEFLELTPELRKFLRLNEPEQLKDFLAASQWLEMKHKVLARVLKGEIDPNDALSVPGFYNLFDDYLQTGHIGHEHS